MRSDGEMRKLRKIVEASKHQNEKKEQKTKIKHKKKFLTINIDIHRNNLRLIFKS
jgi:hypothetical protein